MSSYPMSCNIAHAKNIRQACFPTQSKMHNPISMTTAITESFSTKQQSTTFTTPMALLSKSPFSAMSDFISKYGNNLNFLLQSLQYD
jgi:hypothetical protein